VLTAPAQIRTCTSTQLSYDEDRKGTIERRLRETAPELPKVAIETVRTFVFQKAEELKSVLLQDRAAAKLALRTHFKPLVLSAKEPRDGPVFTVEGGFDPFAGLGLILFT